MTFALLSGALLAALVRVTTGREVTRSQRKYVRSLTHSIALLHDAKVSAVIRPLLWLTAAVTALLVVPVIYWAASTYGASYQLWDAQHSTYYYAERPGGFAVVITGLIICTLMTIFAAVAVARAALLMARLYGPKRRAVA